MEDGSCASRVKLNSAAYKSQPHGMPATPWAASSRLVGVKLQVCKIGHLGFYL